MYPDQNPELPPIPGVELRFDPEYNEVHCWQAWRDGICIAKSPWKKHTWKEAQKCVSMSTAKN